MQLIAQRGIELGAVIAIAFRDFAAPPIT